MLKSIQLHKIRIDEKLLSKYSYIHRLIWRKGVGGILGESISVSLDIGFISL